MLHSLRRSLVPLLLLTFITTSCVYFPTSRRFYEWTADVCGRKTLGKRLCSGTVTVVLLPVWALAFVIDQPLALGELIFGYAPYKDPLIITPIDATVWSEPKSFPGHEEGELWTIQRYTPEAQGYFVSHSKQGHLIEEFIVEPREDGNFAVYTAGASNTRAGLAHTNQER